MVKGLWLMSLFMGFSLFLIFMANSGIPLSLSFYSEFFVISSVFVFFTRLFFFTLLYYFFSFYYSMGFMVSVVCGNSIKGVCWYLFPLGSFFFMIIRVWF